MHFHLPKPLHGWRAFTGEVGIIVIGVLIALAFEQLVESWRWYERAAEGRERLRAEVGHEFLVLEERNAVTQCIDQQLTRIEDAIMASGAVMKPLPLYVEPGGASVRSNYTFRTPSRSWSDSAWQSVISEGLPAHLTSDERKLLPIHYSQMARASALNAEDDVAAGDLAALSLPLVLDPEVKASFIRVVEGERERSEALGGYSVQMMRTIRELHYVPSASERRDWLANSGTIKFCRAHGYTLASS